MRFVKVERIEGVGRPRYKLQAKLTEFMQTNIKQAQVMFDEGEYVSASSAGASLWKSVKRFGFPIDVRRRGDKVYLIRRDM